MGITIGDLRRERSVSIKDLASLLGIRQKKLRGIERGNEDPGIDLLVAIAEALGVTAAALLEEIEPVELDSDGATGHGGRQQKPAHVDDAAWGGSATVAQRFGACYRNYRRTNQVRPLDVVARAAGVAHSTVAYIERGLITPRVSVALFLADACGVSLSRIFRDAGL